MPAYKDQTTGTWFVKFYSKGWTGENKQVKKRGFKTKKEALDFERNYKMREEGNLDMAFGELFKLYSEDMQSRLKRNTWLTKEHIVRTKILPYFQDKKMNEITASDVMKWQNELLAYKDENGKGLSSTYRRTIHNQLSCIFNHACRYYQLKSNPARQAGCMGKEKKYYAKMYRLGLIEKKGYKYRSAELAKEIKRMHSLQEQYLFICDHNVENVMDLLRLREEAKQTLDRVHNRQKEIYKERYIRKRKCKMLEDFKEYQCWNIDSSKELHSLKDEKKKAKNELYLTEACMKENLYTAYARVDENEELDYGVLENPPVLSDSEKKEIVAEFGIEMITEQQKTMTVEELAEEISATIQKEYVSYHQLSVQEKASLFKFKVEDNYYNLKLHGLVLRKLGIQMYGSECYEDYQSIYQETMRNAEKQGIGYEKKREDKKWEKVRSR